MELFPLRCLSPLLAAFVSAQTPAEGYHSIVQTIPAAASSIAVTGDGTVWFDGNDLLLAPPGQSPRTLLHFAAPRFGAFTLPIGTDELLFAESSFGELWIVPLDPAGTPRLLATVAFPYDAVQLGNGRALVSARTGGFQSVVNDLIAVDLATGAATALGFVPGASGPLALDPTGDLLNATAPLAFPPPAASVEILRWSVGQWAFALAGGPQLTRGNAQLVRGGIDAVGDLAADGDDDLIYLDWINNLVVELDDVHRQQGANVLIDYTATGLSPSALVFRRGAPGAAEFEPFARPSGGSGGDSLFVQETDFAATNQLRELAARAAGLATSPGGVIPAGAFLLNLDAAAASGVALLAIGTVATGIEVPLQLPGFEQTARWDAGLIHPLLAELLPIDALGRAVLVLNNPGLPGGLLIHVQAAFASPLTMQLGATALRSVQLGP